MVRPQRDEAANGSNAIASNHDGNRGALVVPQFIGAMGNGSAFRPDESGHHEPLHCTPAAVSCEAPGRGQRRVPFIEIHQDADGLRAVIVERAVEDDEPPTATIESVPPGARPKSGSRVQPDDGPEPGAPPGTEPAGVPVPERTGEP